MTCVACTGPAFPDGHTLDGTLFRCDGCGTRRIELAGHSAVPVEYGAAYRDGADHAKLGSLIELFRRHVGTASGSLLDIGCGDGSFLDAARALGWSVEGLELDPAAVAIAREKAIPISLGRAPDENVTRAFTAITLWDLIEHVDDPRATARWLADRCLPRGRVIVLTPDAGSIFDRIAAWERAATRGRSSRVEQLCLNRYHLHRFTAAGLSRLFESAGFRTAVSTQVQLFSLRPDRYLSGFAPGIAGFSRRPWLDARLSRAAHATVSLLGLTNKLLYVGIREEAS